MDSELINELGGRRIPVVFYDVGEPRRSISKIRVDYRHGMGTLTSFLYSLGHRRLGFIAHHGPVNERSRAVLDAVARYPDLHVETSADTDTFEEGRRAARLLLDAAPHLELCRGER